MSEFVPPAEVENDAWFAYRAMAAKQQRETDERTFRDAFRTGVRFTFGATSRMSPTLDAFVAWMQYVSDWAPPPAREDVAA